MHYDTTSKESTDTDEPDDQSYQDETTLRRLYVDKGLTQAELADKFDVSQPTISKWIDRHNIPVQDARGNTNNDHLPVSFRSRVSSGSGRWYEIWLHHHDHVRVHRLLAVAEYGFDAVADMDVHHKNNIPWDNRPENIELLDHGAHSRLHATDGGSEAGEA